MDYLVIEGVRPWDGRYEFDLVEQPLTRREWGWIKRFANYLPLTIWDGWRGRDPELFFTLAICALYRARKIQPDEAQEMFDRFADVAFDPVRTVRIEADDTADEEADAGPPASKPNGNASSSGPGSTTSSEISRPIPPPSGIPVSATSASVAARSAT